MQGCGGGVKDGAEYQSVKSKRKVVDLRLKALLRQQEKVRRYRGKLNWQGDLDAMRIDKLV